jgi:hypothetical protein
MIIKENRFEKKVIDESELNVWVMKLTQEKFSKKIMIKLTL